MAIQKITYPGGLTTTLFDDWYQMYNDSVDKIPVSGSVPTNGILRMECFDTTTFDIALPNFEDKINTGLTTTISGSCPGPFQATVGVGAYQLGGVVYNVLVPIVLNISGLDPTLDRVDVVYADGNIGLGVHILTGVPSLTPVKPNLIPGQIEITTITVKSIANCAPPSVVPISDFPNFKRLNGAVTGEPNGSIYNFVVGNNCNVAPATSTYNFIFGKDVTMPNSGGNYDLNTSIGCEATSLLGERNVILSSKAIDVLGDDNFIFGIQSVFANSATFSRNIVMGNTDISQIMSNDVVNIMATYTNIPNLTGNICVINGDQNQINNNTSLAYCSLISSFNSVTPNISNYSIWSGITNSSNITAEFNSGFITGNANILDNIINNSIICGASNQILPSVALSPFPTFNNNFVAGINNQPYGGNNNLLIGEENEVGTSHNSVLAGSFNIFGTDDNLYGNIVAGIGNFIQNTTIPGEECSNSLLLGSGNTLTGFNQGIFSSQTSILAGSKRNSAIIGCKDVTSDALNAVWLGSDSSNKHSSENNNDLTTTVQSLKVGGGLSHSFTIAGGSTYTMLYDDYLIYFDSTGDIAVDIPASMRTVGKTYVFKNNANTRNITITATSSTIDGGATAIMTLPYEVLKVTFIDVATGWILSI